MNDLEFSFEPDPWEVFRLSLTMGDTVSASQILTLLEGEDGQVLEDALQELETACVQLDISDLPKNGGTGETAVRLKQEAQLVCAGRYDVDGGTGEKTVGLCPQRLECVSGEELAGRIFLWDHCDSSACDKLYRRELFDGIRYPEGKTCEDVPVTYRLALKARCAVLCDRPFYNYYHRSGSISKGAGITEKTCHYSPHTALTREDIRKNHPKIAPQAEFLRVHSLYHILLRLDHAAPDIRKTYRGEYRKARAELAKHWKFILTCPWLTKQQRVTDFLLIASLYHLLRPMFHKA